jgi:hypothetical protein
VKRPPGLAVALALVAAAGAAVAAVALWAGRDEAEPALRPVDLRQCRGLVDAATLDCYTREFLALVDDRDDPRPAVQAIADAAWREGGFVLSSCHGVMHTVGRTYARDAGVTLGTLMDYLPETNDPGCSAGFAHGLVTGVAPLIDPRRPREAATVCAEAGTRYRRYSCVHGLGHAFMRIHDERLAPALALCRLLGASAAPDCAQGAYHDYWFAVVGADELVPPEEAVRDPRALCGDQPAKFVRPCWYRAFVDNRPEGIEVDSPEHLEVFCAGLEGLQRSACITAVAVIGPAEPAAQLEVCAALARPPDGASCIRGTKVQNLRGSSIGDYVRLISRCDQFGAETRPACYRWLGKTIAVVTDGRFLRAGCPSLDSPAARSECAAGARSMEEALVTFS